MLDYDNIAVVHENVTILYQHFSISSVQNGITHINKATGKAYPACAGIIAICVRRANRAACLLTCACNKYTRTPVCTALYATGEYRFPGNVRLHLKSYEF